MGIKVQQAWCDIGIGSISQITVQVRSKLLDFLLELSEKVGSDMSKDEAKRVAQSPETGSMFNNAIFGDNVTILVGDHSQQRVHFEIGKGDFSALAEFLKSNKVAEPVIEALKVAIEKDSATPEVAQMLSAKHRINWIYLWHLTMACVTKPSGLGPSI